MKKILTITIGVILMSCGDNITISKDEYRRLKGDTINSEYPKPFNFKYHWGCGIKWGIILGEDNHEYLKNNLYDGCVVMHYIDCKLCRSRVVKTNNSKND